MIVQISENYWLHPEHVETVSLEAGWVEVRTVSGETLSFVGEEAAKLLDALEAWAGV